MSQEENAGRVSIPLQRELEAFEPQSVYDAAMEMRYTKTGVTDTSKIKMVFGIEVYYALVKHSLRIAMSVDSENNKTFEGVRFDLDYTNIGRLAMKVSV